MVSVFRYHEISESSHRILNPMSVEKLLLLGEICRVGKGTMLLDLACGKGEMLCLFAREFGASGVGVDIYAPYLEDARARAVEFGVERSVTFVEGDAGEPPNFDESFNLVSCLGATWIGGGLAGTLKLMRTLAGPGSWLVVGEPYWADPPSPQLERKYGTGDEGCTDLSGTLDRFEVAGVDLVEMVLSDPEDWDRYASSQWLNVSDWLAANPDDPAAAEIREERDVSRREYLANERRCLGWGVFVLRNGR